MCAVNNAQIKSVDGRQTYLLRLPPCATLADVHRCLDAHLVAAGPAGEGAGSGAAPATGLEASPAEGGAVGSSAQPGCGPGGGYHLRAAFPTRVFADSSQTLQEAGLVPSGTLFMQAAAVAARSEAEHGRGSQA